MLRNYMIWIGLLFFSFWFTSLHSQYSIEGLIVDSKQEYKKIILEYLPSIRELNGADMSNIINSYELDSTGYFLLEGSDLNDEKALYRLSLSRVNEGIGIGNGANRNFIHIVLSNNSQLQVFDCTDVSYSFANCIIEGDIENAIIQDFYDVLLPSFLEDNISLNDNNSELKKQLVNKKHLDILINYCDTSQHLIPSLIAYAHINNIDAEIKNHPNFFKRFISKITKISPRSPYVIELKNEFETKEEIIFGKQKNYSKTILVLLGGFVTIMGFYILILRIKLNKLGQSNISVESIEDKLKRLSKKEFEVFELIASGLSNKEIANSLFIEVTTVKSHVSKIYQKLKIGSRKEAIEIGQKRS